MAVAVLGQSWDGYSLSFHMMEETVLAAEIAPRIVGYSFLQQLNWKQNCKERLG